VVLPAKISDLVGCLQDQVRLTHALNEELNQTTLEIHQFYNQEAEASRRIKDLESLCKQQEEAISKLQHESMSLEMGLDRMGEEDDEGDAANEGTVATLRMPLKKGMLLKKKTQRC
jgi:septal ring factor EnvC (AmiA/AmiB activator)